MPAPEPGPPVEEWVDVQEFNSGETMAKCIVDLVGLKENGNEIISAGAKLHRIPLWLSHWPPPGGNDRFAAGQIGAEALFEKAFVIHCDCAPG